MLVHHRIPSMKWQGVLLLLLDGMLVHHRIPSMKWLRALLLSSLRMKQMKTEFLPVPHPWADRTCCQIPQRTRKTIIEPEKKVTTFEPCLTDKRKHTWSRKKARIPLILTVISIKFLLVISMLSEPLRSLRIWSPYVNFLHILITYKKSMGTR